jgi:trk system potassium uptake protein TrkA
MKIIIAGAGETGTYLAEMLYKEDEDIIILDLDKERLEYIDAHYDFLTQYGSVTSIKDLKSVNVHKADLFIALTQSEEVNLVASTLAKKLGAKKVISRIDNKEYLENGNDKFFKALGIDSLIYPEIIASMEVMELINRVGASKTYSFAEGKLFLFAIKIKDNAPVLHKTLQEATTMAGDYEFRAVAITRNGETIIPKGPDVFNTGDLFYVICKPDGVDKLMQLSGKKHFKVENIMIMGGSRIGVKTASLCEKECNVKLIEQDRAKCEQLTEILKNTLIINGDGRNTDLLIEEGITNMQVFIAVTGNSETNILSCLHAQKLGVPKIIAEVEKLDYLPLAQQMGIETVINKKLIAAGHIYKHIMSKQVSSVNCLLDSNAEILEYTIPKGARITKKELKDIDFPKKAIIGGIIRNGEAYIAKGDSQVQPGDRVVVFSLPEAIEKLGKFLT